MAEDEGRVSMKLFLKVGGLARSKGFLRYMFIIIQLKKIIFFMLKNPKTCMSM